MLKNIGNWFLSSPRIVNLLSYVSLATLLAYSGPFGTLGLGPYSYRVVFWVVIVFGSVCLGRLCRHAIDRFMAQVGALKQDLVIVLAMTALVTPLLWGFVRMMAGNTLMVSFWGSAQYVVVVTAGFCVLRRSLPGTELQWYFSPYRVEEQPAELKASAIGNVLPRLARRLPGDFVHPILRLTVDDHLVEVVGTEGAARLRMRFADAVDEMEPVEGFCTHRSHWVARSAFSCVVREDGQLRVRLINGDLVPVSRKYRKNLEELDLI